ncbi:MAG TPA: hypothetical protein VNA22_05410, partial [Pyrinomonadaceae bacterium]|nr:hypothetical protein [Pyrinomonadaceae bacterium]
GRTLPIRPRSAMKKLILGIIAVLFLQIAFFTYSAIRGPLDPVAEIVTPDFQRSSRDLARMYRAEIAAPQEIPATEVEYPSRRPSLEVPKADVRETTVPESRSRRREVPYFLRDNGSDASGRFTSKRSSMADDIVITRAATTAGRRHVVVFTDYPIGAGTYFPKPPKALVEARTAKKDSVRRPPELSPRPKKRSYVERTLPALVKKPWGWVKSLAAKFD